MSRYVRCVKDNRGVMTLRLDRPDKHNALNAELISELLVALKTIDDDEHCRALIFTAEGETFSSGADVTWMQAAVAYDENQNRRDAQQLADLMARLYALNIPTIARVNGGAYGGGLGLLACCDMAVAVDKAQFSFTEVRLGLIPAIISPYIVANIGVRQARRLFMTAERFTARQALEYGLVDRCVAVEDLDNVVEKYVSSLLKAGPQALRECKALIRQLAPLPQTDNLAQWIGRVRVSVEGQSGLRAFLNKTNPPWLEE